MKQCLSAKLLDTTVPIMADDGGNLDTLGYVFEMVGDFLHIFGLMTGGDETGSDDRARNYDIPEVDASFEVNVCRKMKLVIVLILVVLTAQTVMAADGEDLDTLGYVMELAGDLIHVFTRVMGDEDESEESEESDESD
ncbi:hypothetical protein HDE_05639 [Halotydeus destructor]|nr:hypothetical protein HDE_05639 [Halotydeus destructor]